MITQLHGGMDLSLLSFISFDVLSKPHLRGKLILLTGYYNTRVGWWISKVGENGVKWKLFGIETAVVKGFFSKINILEDKF